MKLKSPSRKLIIWLSVFILLITWSVHRHNQGIKDAKLKAKVDAQLSKEMEIKRKIDLENFSHGMYQSYICGFSKKLQPVSEMLINISKKTSIPPDFVPVMKDFNNAVEILSTPESVFLGRDGKLSEEELKIHLATKSFAKELNLKTAELEQGIIKFSNPYFSKLNNTVTSLVAPACALYETTHPKKPSTPRPIINEPRAQGSVDAQIDRIGKQLSFDTICKLNSSGKTLLADILNAQSSKAFKNTLLESSKSAIYDLGFAAFSFNGKSLYSPNPNEKLLGPEFEALKGKLEKSRFSYWFNSSSSELSSMRAITKKMQVLGKSGCAEVKKLKESQ